MIFLDDEPNTGELDVEFSISDLELAEMMARQELQNSNK